MFSKCRIASSQILLCKTSSFVKSFLEDTLQGQHTLSYFISLVCEEKYVKPVFSTPLYLCLFIILLGYLCYQFCKQFRIEQSFFKPVRGKKEKKGKKEEFKGRHKCARFRNHLQREEVDWQV